MKTKVILISIILLFLLIVLGNGFYILDERKQAVITRFGKPVGGTVAEAGMHWKTPLIERVHFFEKRIMQWDGDANQIPTKDKKYIWVDLTARWKIQDPLVFLQSVGNETGAHGRLDDIVDAVTRDYVSDHILLDLVRNSNREFISTDLELISETETVTESVEIGREKITREILTQAQSLVIQFGIELVDVRIKRINYVEEVQKKVYERMISERKRIAERYRSEGQGQMAEIEGLREKELQKISSEAYRRSQEIRGKADAEATRIYANAFNKDPEFYSFLRTLQSYRDTMDSTTTILLTTKSEYLKFLKGIK